MGNSKNTKVNINEEISYFQSIDKKNCSITPANRAEWRKETVLDRYLRINELVYERFDGKILCGPFMGMRIPKNPTWKYTHVAQMILGIYESPVLNVLQDSRFLKREVFVDIGAADGYYPIGLCYSKRMKKAFAYEIDAKSRSSISASAIMNGVGDSIVIRSEANDQELSKLADEIDMNEVVILVDIEGGEFDLLGGEMLSKLKKAVLIIEIHNWIDDFINKYDEFLKKAEAYFNIELLEYDYSKLENLNVLSDFPDDNRFLLLSEGRPCLMHFLLMTPKC
jgi:hypothetical protein